MSCFYRIKILKKDTLNLCFLRMKNKDTNYFVIIREFIFLQIPMSFTCRKGMT